MKRLLMSTAAAAILLTGCEAEPEEEFVNPDAEANETAKLEPAGANGWDTNEDGLLQQDEYTAWGQSGFDNWDTNADAQLGQDEFTTGLNSAGLENADGAFASFDDNGDDFLSEEEFFDNEEWDEWDPDGDGILEIGELGA